MHGFLYGVLALLVQCACGFIQYEQLGRTVQCAGNGHALPLSAGKFFGPLAEGVVHPAGQLGNEVVQCRHAAALHELVPVHGIGGNAEGHVLGDAAVGEEGVLPHIAHARHPAGGCFARQGRSVYDNAAFGREQQAYDKVCQRALAGTGAAHKPHCFAGADAEIHAMQGIGRGLTVAEAQPFGLYGMAKRQRFVAAERVGGGGHVLDEIHHLLRLGHVVPDGGEAAHDAVKCRDYAPCDNGEQGNLAGEHCGGCAGSKVQGGDNRAAQQEKTCCFKHP